MVFSTIEILALILIVFSIIGIWPIILTGNMFEYYVREYRPTLFFNLQNSRSILFGEDLLENLPNPLPEVLAQSVLNQALNIMIAPAPHAYGETREAMVQHGVRAAWRSMSIKLYLDTGGVGPHKRCVYACQEQYNKSLFEEIRKLSEWYESDDKLARFAHGLLRQNALDINAKLERLGQGAVMPTPFILSNTCEGIA